MAKYPWKINLIFRNLGVLCWLVVAMFLMPGKAHAQQIVSDPQLNQMLLAFKDSFANSPLLTNGSTPLIELTGSQNKVAFVFQQQGQYVFDYGELEFIPTNPISANRFSVQLSINTLTLVGDGSITITNKGKSFNLPCNGNQFAVGPVAFSVMVEIGPAGEILLSNMETIFDPNNTQLSIPCLQSASFSDLTGKSKQTDLTAREIALLAPERDSFNAQLTAQFNELLLQELPLGKKIPKGVLNNASAGVKTAARNPTSAVSTTSNNTAIKTCMAITTVGGSTCGSAVLADLQTALASLAAGI
jgi:hypothetical protein